MSTLLMHPRGGVPEVLSSPDDIAAAADFLASGEGPLAVDTERAGSYVYDDRAQLIQVRRHGAGTFLLDPESVPGAIGEIVPVMNTIPWILHAAASDLPSLNALGMSPPNLFDTEIAGRLLGIQKVNLAALTEEFLGTTLAKGHGRENWATRPIPDTWRTYAALDVELLPELSAVLSDTLAEMGRLDWLIDETDALLHIHEPAATPLPGGNHHVSIENAPEDAWRGLKGIGRLRSPEQLVIAREMWTERDRLARRDDVAPTSILPHSVIVEAARVRASDQRDLAAVHGFPSRRRSATTHWSRVITSALATPRDSWPTQLKVDSIGGHRPHHRDWPEKAPAASATLEVVAEAVSFEADQLGIDSGMLLPSKGIRSLAWELSADALQPLDTDATVREYLRNYGVRPWQEDILTGLVDRAVLLPRRQARTNNPRVSE